MLGDARVSITVDELDNLRNAEKKWKEYYNKMYDDRLKALEDREKQVRKEEKELEENIGKVLVCDRIYDMGAREYNMFWRWRKESDIYKKLREKWEAEERNKCRTDIIDYLRATSIFTIWNRNRRLEK